MFEVVVDITREPAAPDDSSPGSPEDAGHVSVSVPGESSTNSPWPRLPHDTDGWHCVVRAVRQHQVVAEPWSRSFPVRRSSARSGGACPGKLSQRASQSSSSTFTSNPPWCQSSRNQVATSSPCGASDLRRVLR
jgi:hypothetical protein